VLKLPPESSTELVSTVIRRTKSAKRHDNGTASTSAQERGDGQRFSRSPSPRDQQMDEQPPVASTSSQADELSLIRELLRPPPIPGLQDWGIQPEPSEPCSQELQTKLGRFHSLKRDQNRHFNDSLMSNRAFRNPHIYAKLVEFVDVKETATNFPKEIWDPFDVREEWYADQLAERQKVRSEGQAAAQAPGKRTSIAFTSASSQPPSSARTRDRDKDKSRYQPHVAGVLGGGGSQKRRADFAFGGFDDGGRGRNRNLR